MLSNVGWAGLKSVVFVENLLEWWYRVKLVIPYAFPRLMTQEELELSKLSFQFQELFRRMLSASKEDPP